MNKEIQIKRNKPSRSNYRVLYAKTGRKRRLHAATTATADQHAGMGSDVPNIGIGRALLVILVLHVLAIAAIYMHSAFIGNASDVTANEGQKAPSGKPVAAAAVVAAPVKKAKPAAPAVAVAAIEPSISDPASERYIVVSGDSYARIAGVRNVNEQSLRALNSNRPLRAGVVLDLPAELSSRPVNPTSVAPVREKLAQQPKAPVVVAKAVDSNPKSKPSGSQAQRTSEPKADYDVSIAPKAVVVKPNLPEPAVSAGSDAGDSGERYTVKSGDTLWRICNRFKVSRDAVLKLNGIEDPNKLYAGRSIKIPTK